MLGFPGKSFVRFLGCWDAKAIAGCQWQLKVCNKVGIQWDIIHTVDGRNPAPPWMYKTL